MASRARAWAPTPPTTTAADTPACSSATSPIRWSRSTTTKATDCSSTKLRNRKSAAPRLVTLGFGCFFFDYDNDGWQDIFVADGHIEDQIERVQKRVSYAEPPHLFRNLGGGKFAEVTAQMGSVFAAPKVARAAAYADIDNDGFLDVSAHHECRAGLSLSQRRWNESQPAHQAGGHEVESRRHRRSGPCELGKRQAVEDAALRIELPGAE